MLRLGIIGGMGPFASAELYNKILCKTLAERDDEHLHIIIDSNNNIPDRTAGILGRGPSPLPMLIESGKRLKGMGAELLALPCFSSHFYLNALQEELGIPIVSMIDASVAYLKRTDISSVVLLQTEGLAQSGIFEQALKSEKISVILPDKDDMILLMDLIYSGVKANRSDYDVRPFIDFCDRAMKSGASHFLLGCTELPIAFSRYKINYPTVDTISVYAEALILKSAARLKQVKV